MTDRIREERDHYRQRVLELEAVSSPTREALSFAKGWLGPARWKLLKELQALRKLKDAVLEEKRYGSIDNVIRTTQALVEVMDLER